MTTDERIAMLAAAWSEQCYIAVEDHTVDAHQHIAHLIAAGDAVITSLRAAADHSSPAAPTGTCGTCAHFLPWDRATLTGTGDCHHPAYKGRRNGMPDDDGCIKGYTPKATP